MQDKDGQNNNRKNNINSYLLTIISFIKMIVESFETTGKPH